jgi:hypothetical protein
LIIPFAHDLIDSPPAAVMFRISFCLAGVIGMFCALASEILYDESVQAESSTIPLIEFIVAAAIFGFFDLYLDSQLVLLSLLVILVLYLILLFNSLLFKFLEIILFLVIPISNLFSSIKFFTPFIIFVLVVRYLNALLADPFPYGQPWTPGAHVWLIGTLSIM